MSLNRPAAELAVEIVNTAGSGGLDRGWVEQLLARDSLPIMHRSAETSDVGAVLDALTRLADEAARIFDANALQEAASLLNSVLGSVDVRVTVSTTAPFAPHLHYDGHGDNVGLRLRANCLVALATVLADSSGALRLGRCASCGDAFVDFSRSARQRFCARRCATRSHVQAHRLRASS